MTSSDMKIVGDEQQRIWKGRSNRWNE